MKERIALFFDIDGTLFDSTTKSVLPSTIRMLEELAKKDNCDCYLSTGRSHQTLGTMNDYLHFFKGLNLSNGQEIYLDQKLLYEGGICPESVKRLLDIADKYHYSMGMITNQEVEMNFFTETSYHNFTNYVKANVIDLKGEPFDVSKKVYQIWLFASNDEIDALMPLFPELSIVKWGSYGADIIPKGVSKAKGILEIQQRLGYKKENMYAFGDGDNDAEMFGVVGTSVAMKNASPLAKSKATFITEEASKDGLYLAVKRIGLIE